MEKDLFFCQITYIESKHGEVVTFSQMCNLHEDYEQCLSESIDIAHGQMNLNYRFRDVISASFSIYKLYAIRDSEYKKKPNKIETYSNPKEARESLKHIQEQKKKQI